MLNICYYYCCYYYYYYSVTCIISVSSGVRFSLYFPLLFSLTVLVCSDIWSLLVIVYV